MSKLLKIMLIACFMITFAFTLSYGIDLNLTADNSQATNSNTNNTSVKGNSSNNTNSNSNISTNSTNTVEKNYSSATVSDVKSVQDYNTSTITNIINIALIVVGILLIFFAIAILIRLGKR